MSESAAHKTGSSGVGLRLVATRSGVSQPDRATQLGVHKNTYARWERGEAGISAEGLVALINEGWNANWILTGDGAMRLDAVTETRAGYGSQEMSPTDLSMAIQLANEKIAAAGKAPTQEQYGKFVLQLYQVLVGGLPDAEIHDFRPGKLPISGKGDDEDGGSTRGR